MRSVAVIVPSALDPEGPVRLEPRPFRRRSDGPIAALFVAAIVGCVAAAVAWGHAAAVLGAVYSSMAFLVWVEAFRSTWAIGPEVLSARRWARWRTIGAEDVTAVDIEPGEPGIDLSIGGAGLQRVVVPLDDWADRPAAVERLVEFLGNAERRGARIDPDVWHALGR